MRKIFKESSNTWGTLDTPFLPRATHKYCLMAEMKRSSVRNTGPEFCRMDRRSSRDSILERSSWDLYINHKLETVKLSCDVLWIIMSVYFQDDMHLQGVGHVTYQLHSNCLLPSGMSGDSGLAPNTVQVCALGDLQALDLRRHTSKCTGDAEPISCFLTTGILYWTHPGPLVTYVQLYIQYMAGHSTIHEHNMVGHSTVLHRSHVQHDRPHVQSQYNTYRSHVQKHNTYMSHVLVTAQYIQAGHIHSTVHRSQYIQVTCTVYGWSQHAQCAVHVTSHVLWPTINHTHNMSPVMYCWDLVHDRQVVHDRWHVASWSHRDDRRLVTDIMAAQYTSWLVSTAQVHDRWLVYDILLAGWWYNKPIDQAELLNLCT